MRRHESSVGLTSPAKKKRSSREKTWIVRAKEGDRLFDAFKEKSETGGPVIDAIPAGAANGTSADKRTIGTTSAR